MKNYISIPVFFLLFLTIQLYGQLETIKEFPRAYDSQEIKELTPVWISDNEILVFYKNSTRDTIFSRRTTNSGQTWSEQKLEQIVEEPTSYNSDMYLFKTLSGRLLFFWKSIPEIVNCSYSDDNGFTWIDTVTITSGGTSPTDFSTTELDTGKIVLSFSSPVRWNRRLSTDNGLTWSLENYFNIPTQIAQRYSNTHIIKLSYSGDSLLAIYSSYGGGTEVIYSIHSTDSGNSWSDTSRIIDTRIDFFDPLPSSKAIRDSDDNIWLTCERKYDLENEDYSQQDISVLRSTDKGISWQQMDNFTSFLGDDYLTGVTSDGENIFVCFNSSRDQVFNQGYFGIIGESEDIFTPPVMLNFERAWVDYENEVINYRAKIIDDEDVSTVVAKLNQNIELFDDGMHNDSLANDSIFGNVFPTETGGRAGDAYAMDLNKITLPFNYKGIIADVNRGDKVFTFELEMTDISGNTGLKETTARIPIRGGWGNLGKFDEIGFLFSSGFFLSGYSNGQLWSNAVASSILVEDYLPGRTGSDEHNPLSIIYVINKRDPAFGYTWQIWKEAVSLGAEFYDGDGDGIYNPVDKNWNGTWDLNEDMPPLIGDEIAWCVYNDGKPKEQRRWNTVDPQGIEVRQTIFATDKPELENVIFIRYSILNTGLVEEVLDSVYFGVWEDGELGDFSDDVVGCDTLLQSAFYYGNQPDNLFGDNPPAFLTSFLQGPIVTTNIPTDSAKNNSGQQIGTETFSNSINLGIMSHTFTYGGVAALGDPYNAVEVRNYLKGNDRFGQSPDPCTWAFGEVKGGVNCNEVNPAFWFSGDPVENIGWLDGSNTNRRNLVSTGPFKLEKDKPQEIIIAYVIGRGNDPLNSVTVARENVQRAIEEYESNFAAMSYTPPPATNPVNSYVLYQNYPNPFNPTTTIRYELPQNGVVTLEIFDILGQKVKTILNEFKRADRYEVTFSSTGLASGVYIYQMKVNEFITSKKMVLVK